jgi:hypothetical protein
MLSTSIEMAGYELTTHNSPQPRKVIHVESLYI